MGEYEIRSTNLPKTCPMPGHSCVLTNFSELVMLFEFANKNLIPFPVQKNASFDSTIFFFYSFSISGSAASGIAVAEPNHPDEFQIRNRGNRVNEFLELLSRISNRSPTGGANSNNEDPENNPGNDSSDNNIRQDNQAAQRNAAAAAAAAHNSNANNDSSDNSDDEQEQNQGKII